MQLSVDAISKAMDHSPNVLSQADAHVRGGGGGGGGGDNTFSCNDYSLWVK